MLPVIASYFKFDDGYRERITRARASRLRFMKLLGVFGTPAVAFPLTFLCLGSVYGAVWASKDRHVGDLHPGSPELRPDARYNVDARIISQNSPSAWTS